MTKLCPRSQPHLNTQLYLNYKGTESSRSCLRAMLTHPGHYGTIYIYICILCHIMSIFRAHSRGTSTIKYLLVVGPGKHHIFWPRPADGPSHVNLNVRIEIAEPCTRKKTSEMTPAGLLFAFSPHDLGYECSAPAKNQRGDVRRKDREANKRCVDTAEQHHTSMSVCVKRLGHLVTCPRAPASSQASRRSKA